MCSIHRSEKEAIMKSLKSDRFGILSQPAIHPSRHPSIQASIHPSIYPAISTHSLSCFSPPFPLLYTVRADTESYLHPPFQDLFNMPPPFFIHFCSTMKSTNLSALPLCPLPSPILELIDKFWLPFQNSSPMFWRTFILASKLFVSWNIFLSFTTANTCQNWLI